jgi:F0F1-type ATP synthase assembly protein I
MNKKESFLNSEYVKIFAQISVWIIAPVIVALIAGKYLDTIYNSAPWVLCVMLGLSFTFSMIMIVKIANKYMNNEKKDLNKKDGE